MPTGQAQGQAQAQVSAAPQHKTAPAPAHAPAPFDFAFTARDTPEIRARIARDLDDIARSVNAADPALRALVLTGGFSRGEGTARAGKPVNDYDLVAVRALGRGGARYRRVASALTQRLGIEVDLLPVSEGWWRRAPPKLFWLDVKLGARVLAGDADVLDRLPAHDAADLPRIEIARLLANRAAGLLLALPDTPGRLDADAQAAKAVIAALDATLLDEGRYAPTLRERLAATHSHADHKLFARAVAWKLDEGAPVAWDEARAALLSAVDATNARAVRDGWAERAVHALRARRAAWQPSREVRHGAWALLARPQHALEERIRLLSRRSRTLQ